jgi:hypothetical protein
MLSLGLIAVAAIVVVLAVFAGTNDTGFTATGYSDVIRFQAEGVATLQVRIFDLSGREIWDSGMVSGDIIDWDRRNDIGERLAYGAYIYSAQGWNAQGDVNFQKNGKLALMPGDKVQLQAAPLPTPVSPFNPLEDQSLTVQPKGLGDTGIFGQVGIGTASPSYLLDVYKPTGWAVRVGTYGENYCLSGNAMGAYQSGNPANLLLNPDGGNVGIGTASPSYLLDVYKPTGWAVRVGTYGENYRFSGNAMGAYQSGNPANLLLNPDGGNVGIGTSNATARLTVEAGSGDLIAAYNSSNRVFVVKNTGEVRADGAYYGASFNTVSGAADVAERINTSEWVEPGNVVEIDPEHPGFFRKSFSPYSTKVAGIISTSPGVILGNNFDEATDDWEDNRPVLAVTGRVPCKVSAENGPIQIGDLLVASSTSGVAMKGNPERAIGAVVGKAMEPLEDGTGTIVVQVMLR